MPVGFGQDEVPVKHARAKSAKGGGLAAGSAEGLGAIDAALADTFPGRPSLHWDTNRVPGQDGIYRLRAIRDGAVWLFVTYGLSELFAKHSEDPAISGWGFELTMRVPADGDQPPVWPRILLDSLGRYVFSWGRPFAAGHRFDFGEPLTQGDPPTELTAGAFAIDPTLGRMSTPNGAVTFLTLVGINADELARMKARGTAAVIDEIAVSNPHLVTEPRRPSAATSVEERPPDWPFDQDPNALAITVRSIVAGDPILFVSHDADDRGWQFLDGREPEAAEGRLIGMAHALRRDPTLRDIADLPPGWMAARTSAADPWVREPQE
jgi:hypothetical protein